MTLSEKIIYYRKKAMLSQEALAEKLGVSRQAISKWETGESLPEVSNLSALAKALGVTIDHLLSPDEVITEKTESGHRGAKWFFKKFGWLFGIGASGFGIIMIVYGAIMRASIVLPFSNIVKIEPEFNAFLKESPVYVVGGYVIVFGIILALLGAVAAFLLKRKAKN